MTSFPFGQTITIVRGAVSTRTRQWAETERFDVAGCAVAPTASTETLVNADTLSSDVTVYAPSGTDVRYTDRVIVNGDLYDVVGTPNDWGSPFTGWSPGCEIKLVHHEG